SSWKYIQKREKEYYVLLLLLQTMVLGVFSSMDLFLFYLFFEVSLVPMYFLTQDLAITTKVSQATIGLLAGNDNALRMVNSTVQAATQSGTGSFNIVYMQAIGSVIPMGTLQVLLFFAFALGFAIKVPMWPFHTWLPDAHVEAP